MKRFWLCSFLLALCCVARAEGPDAQFVRIYKLIQDADVAVTNQQARLAADNYLQAQTELIKLQTANPTWNERVVKFRLNYLSEKLAALKPLVPPSKPAAIVPSPTEPLKPPDARSGQAELQTLNEQLRQMAVEKQVLEAK